MAVSSFLGQRERLLKIALVAVLALWPLLFRNDFVLSLMTVAGIYAAVVLGLVVLTGQAGQLSFGHAAFFGTGAYTCALLATRLQVPTLLALLAGAVVAGLVALLVGRPVLRLRYFFLAVATIGLVQIFTVLIRETRTLTGGANGLGGIPPLAIGPFAADGYLSQYYVAWVLAFGLLWFAQRALASRFGRALRALAASDVAATTLGIRVANWKLLAFVVSAVYAGLAGGLFALSLSAINPNDFTFGGAVVPVIMLLVGGASSLWGALAGTILMSLIGRAFSSLPEYSGIFYAITLLLLLLFLPEGLAGGLHAGQREWLRRRFAFLGRTPKASSNGVPTPEQRYLGASPPPNNGGSPSIVPATQQHDAPSSQNGSPPRPRPTYAAQADLLRIEGVSVSFGGLKAVNEVSLTILEGHINALIGPNGAGKTTCFNVISGLQLPTEGRLWFAGQDVTGRPAAEIARLGMARTFQNLRIFGNMTVLENVLVGRHRHERAGLLAAGLGLPSQRVEEQLSRARAMEALALVGLAERADAPAASLPYGQQRLVEIARALATEPRLLLLDEPAAGMNATERAHLIEQIIKIRDSGVTVLLVEHDIHMVMGLSDTVSVLDYGRLIASGEPEEVKKHPAVIEAYLGVPQEDLGKHPAVVEMYEHVEHAEELGAHVISSVMEPDPPVEPAQPLLDVSGLSTFYGSIQAVREVSFTVPAGEIVAVLGANGAGKTTLLRTISGVLRSRSGKVVYDGTDLTRLPPAEIVARGLCQVPEGRQIFSTLSVADNLTLGASGRRERGDLSQDLTFVYDLFPILAERRTQLAGTLSGGQQQMLAMGRALLGRPRLLLLDEPSMGLAPLVVEQIFEALQKLNQQGLTILMVEQYAEMALEVAHSAIVLQTGQVALAGRASQLRQDDRVRELYLGH